MNFFINTRLSSEVRFFVEIEVLFSAESKFSIKNIWDDLYYKDVKIVLGLYAYITIYSILHLNGHLDLWLIYYTTPLFIYFTAAHLIIFMI